MTHLIEADHGTSQFTYGFDLSGNLVNLNGVSRTYDAANRLVHDGTQALTYDANGNLTNDGTNSFTWDRGNRLLSHAGISYKYNGDGVRVQQDALKYILDVQPELALVIGDSDGNRYVHGPRGLHAVQEPAGEWMHPITDALGSIRGYIDPTGGVLSTVHYGEWGVPSPSIVGPAFTGEPRDANGLQNHRARYYAPGLAVWTALDPWEGLHERPMSLNGYGWVEGDPVNLTDASGKTPWLAALLNSGPCADQGHGGCFACFSSASLEAFLVCMSQCQPSRSLVPTPTPFTPIPTFAPITPSATTGPTATHVPFFTNTPIPTATMPPLTNTPLPPTPLPFGLPMTGACFSDATYTTRPACTGLCIPSQDINRPGSVNGNYPVLAPAVGEVMIVAPARSYIRGTEGNNADRGNFVAIRVHVSAIPSHIKGRISNISDSGYLYIGYAHLHTIDVGVQVGNHVNLGTELGLSGNTGLRDPNNPNDPTTNAHLDLTLFFMPIDAGPRAFGGAASSNHNIFNSLAFFEQYYPPGTQLPLDVRPSDVWPELGTCP